DSGVLLIDRAGAVSYANARLGQLLGAPSERLLGRPRDEALAGLLLPGDQDGAARWHTAPPGDPPRILRRFSDEVLDSDGSPLGLIEVYTDITELEAVNQLKDEFVAAAAHDLKTPVTAIKGYAQIAMRLARRLEDQRIVQQLEIINARSNDLTYLMDSILDLSRIQAGRLRLELSAFAAQDALAKIIQQLDYDLQRQRRAVDLVQPAAPVMVSWDRARIERVLLNLLGNAIKYSPAGGPLGLLLRQPAPGEVELVVTDHGIGIPPEERERIFERFYRVRQAIDDGFKGTGMGLYLARSVVEEHGGRIWAADALHGGPGTSVFVSLPAEAPAEGA
ncbi:MAG TPA: ATP-binding protein, partial [Herpetosiphonaceae bacterium]